MAVRMVVLSHKLAAVHVGLLLNRLEDHSLDNSWKQTEVQVHGGVRYEVHVRHVRHVRRAIEPDEADNCSQEHASRRTRPGDVVDRVDPNIRTGCEESYDGLENGDTGRRDPENPETLRLPYPVPCEDRKHSDATSNRNLTVEEEAAEGRSHRQTWRLDTMK